MVRSRSLSRGLGSQCFLLARAERRRNVPQIIPQSVDVLGLFSIVLESLQQWLGDKALGLCRLKHVTLLGRNGVICGV